ncbi:Rha family transcriptional regulator [Thomasclavelia cocleata]|uniref:Rha family transcriptional regulator n=1 Tax=Thomasclavelia cocleata TaxID=69824 RepID=UPI00242D0AB1|nr:Rha family transcriptional regulator [Thomasclavelia cocleata]
MSKLIIANHIETIDSREVAEMVGMQHKHLLEKVRNYEHILTSRNLGSLEFFIPSEYQDTKGETRKCYLLTKKGCEMVANKLTGEKGVIFTAQYVNRFEEMEKAIKTPALPNNYLEALERLVDEVKYNQQLILENNQLKFKLECKENKVNRLWSTEEIAKEHNMSAKALNKVLQNQKIQYSRKGRWHLYRRYKNKGYVKIKHNWLKWTNEGRLFIEQTILCIENTHKMI